VSKRLPDDGDAQIRKMREIGFAQLARPMLLHEVHFLRRSFRGTPALDPPLQRAQLSIGEPVRVLPLQRREDRLRLQSGIGAQLLADLRPHPGEAIRPCPPMTRRFHFARQTPRLQVFQCRLHVHPRLRRCDFLGFLALRQFE
jgi:hypothetical protein